MQYPITIHGIPMTEYVIEHGSSKQEEYAAGELKYYFEKIAGVSPAGDGSRVIRIMVDPHSGLQQDGFTIRNTENELSITGGGGRGVIYGVYDILEKYLGVRYFLPDLEKLGEGGDIPLGEYTEEPVFKDMRDSDWICGRDPKWRVKNRIYGTWSHVPDEMGGMYRCANTGCHSMDEILGVPQHQQPCLSDPENLKKAISFVHESLRKNPDVDIVEVSQNDCCNYCTCEKCAAVDAEEGSHMGTMIRFVNAIADSIKDEYPKVAVRTFAYQYTRKPAKTAPRDNVIIRLCSIECCFSHQLDDPTCELNEEFQRDTEGWGKICNRISIWDYVTDFHHYLITFPNFDTLRPNMRYFAEHGVSGMYSEGNYQCRSGEFNELRAYLLAKLMWNPYMSEKEYRAHMDEFLAAYYGDGWRFIRAYIDFLCGESKGQHMRCYATPADIISPEMVKTMYPTIENWWNTAEAMAGDRLDAVKRSRIQWMYLSLWGNYDKDRAAALLTLTKDMNLRWREGLLHPVDPDIEKDIKEWI